MRTGCHRSAQLAACPPDVACTLIPVFGRKHFLGCGFARRVQGYPPQVLDQREQFSAIDKRLAVFLEWDAQERVRGLIVLRVYGEDNQLAVDSKPRKIDVKPGSGSFTSWELTVPQRAGTYRADVFVGESVFWRGYFRVIP
jgi:hypothetical protein